MRRGTGALYEVKTGRSGSDRLPDDLIQPEAKMNAIQSVIGVAARSLLLVSVSVGLPLALIREAVLAAFPEVGP